MKHVSLAVLLCLVSVSCSSPDSVPEALDHAMQTAEQMTSEGWLERSSFFVLFPDGTPKQYVSFLFSSIGAAEAPPVEGTGELPSENQGTISRFATPSWPAGVGMAHSIPDPAKGTQVVWKWDDARRMIILEGYIDPLAPPAVIRETRFPQNVIPSQLARIAAEANRETGGTAQGF